MSTTAQEKKESIIAALIQARRKILDVAYAPVSYTHLTLPTILLV